MRLLVIEDERDLCEDIAKKLRLSGYEADTCADGEAALELLAVEKYDLVLLDLNLPKVDGMTVLRTCGSTIRKPACSSCRHAVKYPTRLTDWMPVRTIICPSRSIWRSWRRGYAA